MLDRLRDWIATIADLTRFLSRLPLPSSDRSPRPLATTLGYAPLAGLLIALGPALLLAGATLAGLPSLVATTLAVAAMILATGGLHEDGLADTADGFGGGSTRERKLEIMRDSRIGAFGALALACGLLLRVGCLQSLTERAGPAGAALALVAAAVLSRALMLVPMALLAPVRADGLARTAGTPNGRTVLTALCLGLPIASVLALGTRMAGFQVIVGLLLSIVVALGMTRLARDQLGGVTGDVVGATQQVTEAAFLIALCAGVPLL